MPQNLQNLASRGQVQGHDSFSHFQTQSDEIDSVDTFYNPVLKYPDVTSPAGDFTSQYYDLTFPHPLYSTVITDSGNDGRRGNTGFFNVTDVSAVIGE